MPDHICRLGTAIPIQGVNVLTGINKREVVKLAHICINAIGTPAPGPVNKSLKVWSSQGTSVTILGVDGARASKKLIQYLKTGYVEGEAVTKIYAEKTLNSKVQKLISDIVNRHDRYATKAQVRSVVDEWVLRFHADFPLTSYYVPIVNLKLAVSLSIGKVVFHPLTPELVDQLLRSHSYIVDHTKASERLKDKLKQDAAELLQGENCRVLAEVSLAVDESLGDELCIEYVEQSLNVLRYYGYFLYSPSQQAYIGIQGRLSRGILGTLYVVPEKQSGSSYRHTGPLVTYDLSGEYLDRVKTWALDFLSRLLANKPTNELEAALITSIEWSGRASQSLQPEGRYLNLWTAVETLLMCNEDKGREETQGQLIARRAALMLDSKKGRESIQNLWNDKLYRVRSDLVHRGSSLELADYLPKLEFYAPLVIMSYIKKLETGSTWSSKIEFLSWLEGC